MFDALQLNVLFYLYFCAIGCIPWMKVAIWVTLDWLMIDRFSTSGASSLLRRHSPARRRSSSSSRRFIMDSVATSPTGCWDCSKLNHNQVSHKKALLLNGWLTSMYWEEPQLGWSKHMWTNCRVARCVPVYWSCTVPERRGADGADDGQHRPGMVTSKFFLVFYS